MKVMFNVLESALVKYKWAKTISFNVGLEVVRCSEPCATRTCRRADVFTSKIRYFAVLGMKVMFNDPGSVIVEYKPVEINSFNVGLKSVRCTERRVCAARVRAALEAQP